MEPGRSTSPHDFLGFARVLGRVCAARGLLTPSFRSPPRLPGIDRSVRRRANGGSVVAVRLQGRPTAAVAADMIEGVLVANGRTGAEAEPDRSELWAALAPLLEPTVRAA
jgi:hypothetical protein